MNMQGPLVKPGDLQVGSSRTRWIDARLRQSVRKLVTVKRSRPTATVRSLDCWTCPPRRYSGEKAPRLEQTSVNRRDVNRKRPLAVAPRLRVAERFISESTTWIHKLWSESLVTSVTFDAQASGNGGVICNTLETQNMVLSREPTS